jgi:hypothetical protein
VLRFFDAGAARTATIPVGSYSPATLKAAIESAMNAASGGPFVYTFTYSTTTFLTTIAGTGAFDLLFANTTNSIATVLGFQNVDTGAGLLTYTGAYALELNTVRMIYLDIHELPRGVITANSSRAGATFVVPCDAAPGESVIYEGLVQGPQTIDLGSPKLLTELTISIRDQDGNLLDLHGTDWVVNLQYAVIEDE